MQGRVVPPVTELRPVRNPTLAFPPGKVPAQADASLPQPLVDSPQPELWVPPPLEPRSVVPHKLPTRRGKKIWALIVLLLFVLLLGGAAAFYLIRNKKELVVGPGHISTIGEALQKARTEQVDTIRILPGIYQEALRLDQKVHLLGDGPREGIVVNGGSAPALTVESDGGSVTGLTLRCETGADNAKHPAVKISQGVLELENCDISWEGEAGLNRKNAGACVEAAGADVRLVLKTCRLHHGYQGLWVVQGARPELEDCTIENNQVGVWVDKAGGRFRSCKIRQNHAVNVFAAGSGAEVELNDCDILGGEGDGIVLEKEAEGKVVGGTIQDHRGKGNHAVWIREKATASLSGCEVSNNQTGIRVTGGGKAVLSGCKIHDNIGLALEARDAGTSLDASACRRADIYDNGEVNANGEPWFCDEAASFRTPS
jgi:nitrous oxidase accessory protein NosD